MSLDSCVPPERDIDRDERGPQLDVGDDTDMDTCVEAAVAPDDGPGLEAGLVPAVATFSSHSVVRWRLRGGSAAVGNVCGRDGEGLSSRMSRGCQRREVDWTDDGEVGRMCRNGLCNGSDAALWETEVNPDAPSNAHVAGVNKRRNQSSTARPRRW